MTLLLLGTRGKLSYNDTGNSEGDQGQIKGGGHTGHDAGEGGGGSRHKGHRQNGEVRE